MLDANGRKRDGDDDHAWDDYREMGEVREEARREQEWDGTTYDFAGMQMSGEEIDGLMDFIRDPALRHKLIERRAREKGIATQQAAKDVDAFERYGELFKGCNHTMRRQRKQANYESLKPTLRYPRSAK